MKKIFLALFIMVCATTFARNPLKIINSKVAFRTFLQEKASANLVIDWTNAKYDNKKQFADEFNEDDDYAFIQKDCASISNFKQSRSVNCVCIASFACPEKYTLQQGVRYCCAVLSYKRL